MEHQGEYADEVDLREYIEVLWRGKWIIAAITLSAMVFSGLISFFVLDPVYESSTVLAVSPPEEVQAELADPVIAGIIGGTPQAHIRLLQDPAILQRVVSSLKIPVSVAGLAGNVRARAAGDAAKGDRLIEITVKDRSPENARVIAHAVVTEYVSYLSDLVSARLSSRKQAVSAELAEQQARMADAAKQLKELLQKSGGAELLKQEIKARTATLANYRWEDARLSSELRAASESLHVLEQQLKDVPKTIPVVWTSTQEKSDASSPAPGTTAYTGDQINPAYTSLLNEVSQKRATVADLKARAEEGRRAIPVLEKEIVQLTLRLTEEQVAEEKLQRLLDAAESRYRDLVEQLHALEATQAHAVVGSAVGVVAPASTPTEPSGPRRSLNIAIAGVLGVMVSVFAVFLMHYWYSSQPKPGTSSRAATSR